jgi:hypothetical protein
MRLLFLAMCCFYDFFRLIFIVLLQLVSILIVLTVMGYLCSYNDLTVVDKDRFISNMFVCVFLKLVEFVYIMF